MLLCWESGGQIHEIVEEKSLLTREIDVLFVENVLRHVVDVKVLVCLLCLLLQLTSTACQLSARLAITRRGKACIASLGGPRAGSWDWMPRLAKKWCVALRWCL